MLVVCGCVFNVVFIEVIVIGYDCGYGFGGYVSEEVFDVFFGEGYDYVVWGVDVVFILFNFCV